MEERMTFQHFELPPLYFLEKQEQHSNSNETLPSLLLPELLQLCCTHYGNYGTLAKLSAVQSSWRHLLDDAVASHPSQQWRLASCLWDGRDGLAPHPARAVRLWQRLTELPVDALSQSPLVATITTPPIPEQEALPTLHEYAGPAMKRLAYYYLEEQNATGSSSPTEHHSIDAPAVGLQWLRCAHYYGRDADAAYELAMIYEYGHYSVPVDIAAAFFYFQRAAAAGHVEAMVELALCYELGCGCDVNDALSLDWYLQAAQAGHVIAKYSVGEAYEVARGVPQSPEEACLWYYKAAVAGDDDALAALRRLQDIARIVIPGLATALPLLLNDTSG
jgi:TPR repeat protein